MNLRRISALLAVATVSGTLAVSQAIPAKAEGYWSDTDQSWHEGYYSDGWWDENTQTWHDGVFVETAVFPAYQTAAADTAASPIYSYSIPYYSQTDPAWAGLDYGGYTLGSTGCGITSMAMILTGVLGYPITPNMVADVCYPAGTYNHPELGYGVGTLGNARYTAANAFGAASEGVYDYNTFLADLQAGMPISIMTGPGSLYGGSHGIVATGYANGKTQVLDPLGAHSGWFSTEKVYNWHSTRWQDLDAGTTVFAFHSY